MNACRYYFDTTGRRISFEYTLIAGENDSAEGAEALGALLRREMKDRPCHVNLILLNPVKETGLSSPGRQNGEKFCRILEKCGIKKERIHFGKPYPAVYEEVKEHLDKAGVKPEHALAVGDYLNSDIRGANLAGIPSCLVLTGLSQEKDIKGLDASYHPTVIVSKLS
jgi:hypothetical protein